MNKKAHKMYGFEGPLRKVEALCNASLVIGSSGSSSATAQNPHPSSNRTNNDSADPPQMRDNNTNTKQASSSSQQQQNMTQLTRVNHQSSVPAVPTATTTIPTCVDSPNRDSQMTITQPEHGKESTATVTDSVCFTAPQPSLMKCASFSHDTTENAHNPKP